MVKDVPPNEQTQSTTVGSSSDWGHFGTKPLRMLAMTNSLCQHLMLNDFSKQKSTSTIRSAISNVTTLQKTLHDLHSSYTKQDDPGLMCPNAGLLRDRSCLADAGCSRLTQGVRPGSATFEKVRAPTHRRPAGRPTRGVRSCP